MSVICKPSARALAVRDRIAPHLHGIGVHALDYVLHDWAVIPLQGKAPAVAGGKGVLDATTAVGQVIAWWTNYKNANIGGRVPDNAMVLDVDSRHGGLESLARLEDTHGPLPPTLCTFSGRGDGGRHLFYRKPRFRLSTARLGPGIDVKTSSGYTVLAPSVHPDTGMAYTRDFDTPIAQPPDWLQGLLYPQPPVWVPTPTGQRPRYSLRCLVNRVKAAPQGRRNITLFGALRDAAVDGCLDAFAEELIAAARSIGLDDGEIAATFTSARKAAV